MQRSCFGHVKTKFPLLNGHFDYFDELYLSQEFMKLNETWTSYSEKVVQLWESMKKSLPSTFFKW